MNHQEYSEHTRETANASGISATASKAALSTLGILAAGLSIGAVAPAIASEAQPAVQPVAFVAQQIQPTAGTERLQQWENQLRERLGHNGTHMRRVASGTGCVTCCPDADDCGSD